MGCGGGGTSVRPDLPGGVRPIRRGWAARGNCRRSCAATWPICTRKDSASEGFPRCDVSGAGDRKELENILTEHKDAIKERRLEEDRRLLYVALTRARTSCWCPRTTGPRATKPRGPSVFFEELLEITRSALTDPSADSEGLHADRSQTRPTTV